jgi:hypothetical protein
MRIGRRGVLQQTLTRDNKQSGEYRLPALAGSLAPGKMLARLPSANISQHC